jgi:hypothetical protein
MWHIQVGTGTALLCASGSNKLLRHTNQSRNQLYLDHTDKETQKHEIKIKIYQLNISKLRTDIRVLIPYRYMCCPRWLCNIFLEPECQVQTDFVYVPVHFTEPVWYSSTPAAVTTARNNFFYQLNQNEQSKNI